MATSIVNPSGSSPTGFDSINNAFSQIYNMFAPSSSTSSGGTNLFGTSLSGGNQGGGVGSFGISPLTNPDNSLTGEWYNLANLAGPAASSLLTQGGNLVNTGTGTVGAGLGVTGGGLQALQAPMQYYQQLLSGNPAAVTQALAPTAANLSTIETGAMNQASQGMPQGGYRASTMANLPQAQAAQVGNAALGLQSSAAQGEAGLGEQIANIGQGMSQTGLGVGQLGTTLTGQGMQGIQNLIGDVLQKMGINYANSGINQFATLMGGLGSLGNLAGGIGSAATGLGNLGLGSDLSGGTLSGLTGSGQGIYTGSESNPITFAGEEGNLPITSPVYSEPNLGY
jgi:hypothetical protein